MFPGTTSKLSESIVASADTINAKTDVLLLTGTTQINTIRPNFGGGFSGIIFLIPINGNVSLGSSGNINGGPTMLHNFTTLLVYSKIQNKWYPYSGL